MILKVKVCPFCGNDNFSENSLEPVKLIKEISSSFGLPSNEVYRVKCHKCFGAGGAGVTGFNALTGTETTEEEAKRIAFAKWNKRA